jgi:hypothetical protein
MQHAGYDTVVRWCLSELWRLVDTMDIIHFRGLGMPTTSLPYLEANDMYVADYLPDAERAAAE